MYSNCCCSCSFEAEIIKIGQSSHKMYSNNILNFQGSTTILNAYKKKVWKLIICTSYFLPNFGPSSGEDVLQKWCNFLYVHYFFVRRRASGAIAVCNVYFYICRTILKNKKICRQKMSIMFNKIYIYIYIYIYICMCKYIYIYIWKDQQENM